MSVDYPINLFKAEPESLLADVYPVYATRSKEVLRLVKEHRELSTFDAFNKRFKIACGLKITFTDKLNIKREDTRACYELMYRISDLWYALEHLIEISNPEIPKSGSKVQPYSDETMQAIGLSDVESCFAASFRHYVAAESSWRQQVYIVIASLAKNAKGKSKIALKNCSDGIRKRRPLGFNDLLALAYALRNMFVHEGATAALGTKDYKVKRRLYEVVHDHLVLSALVIGSEYAQRVLVGKTQHGRGGGPD